tara:strand:+ start:35394 stop:36788 length:1395 start_codon:yes stop_codon:yes gene_type:complete
MADPKEIVDVEITRNTVVIDTQDFNAVLLLTDDQFMSPDRVRKYNDLSSMLTDGATSDSDTYKAATGYFSQTPRPTQLLVGRRGATELTISLPETEVENNKQYDIVVNNTTYSATASGTAELDTAQAVEDILTALAAAVTVDADITAPVPTPAGAATVAVLTIANNAAIDGPEDGLAHDYTALEDLATAIAAIRSDNDKWYMMGYTNHTTTEQTALAVIVETLDKLAFVSSQTDSSKDLVNQSNPAASDDVMGLLFEADYDRSSGIFAGNADEGYREMAWLGKKSTANPGSTTWMFANLKGQSADGLSDNESQNIRDKNGNTYETIAGVNMVREGKVSSGEYIDIMRGADYLKSRIWSEVLRLLVTTANAGSKVPLTDDGVQQIVAIVEAEIKRSISQDFIKPFVTVEDAAGQTVRAASYEIQVDPVDSIPANQRAQRIAPTIKFIAALSGAVHKTVIRGVLNV